MGNLSPRRSPGEPPLAKPTPDQNLKIIRIVIAGTEPIFRRGLRAVIDTEPDLRVVGEACDGSAAVKLTGKHAPDILLLDLDISGLPGPEVLRLVQRMAPQVRSLILAPKMETPETLEALELGARGVMPKDCSASSSKCDRRISLAGIQSEEAATSPPQGFTSKETRTDLLAGRLPSFPHAQRKARTVVFLEDRMPKTKSLPSVSKPIGITDIAFLVEE